MRPLVALLAFALALVYVPVGSSIMEAPETIVVAFVSDVPSDLAAFIAPYGTVAAESDDLDFAVVRTTNLQAPHALSALRSRSDVVAADVEAVGQLLHTPNDARYAEQWAPAAVRLPQAWDVERGDHAIKVAFLDTGIDTDHPDLLANRAPECGPDGNTAIENGFGSGIEDSQGHGTHVAGIIAATMDNGIGVAGAAETCLMSIKVCVPGCKTSSVAFGVLYAKAHGAKVLSASLGWGRTTTGGANPLILERAAQLAYDADLLFVVAAGNDYCMDPSTSTVNWPGAYNTTLAVAALTSPGDQTAEFSSCGPEVDIASPGDQILSTVVGGGYGIKSGTSMATPLVAGIAGLVWSVDPTLPRDTVRCILENTAADLYGPGVDVRTGHGRVDALAAVTAASNATAVGC